MSFAELLACEDVQERLVLGSRFGFLAFHGGLEGGTAETASAAAQAAGASLYIVTQPPRLRWHIPSHHIGRDASDALSAFLTHVEVAVALHGYGRVDRRDHVLVGGLNRELGSHLAAHLRANLPDYTVIDELDQIPPEMRGLHALNPVNLTVSGGSQLELPPRVRGASPNPAHRGQPCSPDAGLVRALVDTARGWPTSYSISEVPPPRQ